MAGKQIHQAAVDSGEIPETGKQALTVTGYQLPQARLM